jgi:hypothetical protein
MKKRVTLLAGVFLLLAGLGLGLAQTTVVLNSTYVPWDQPTKGWVRVIGYKHMQDDAITDRSLVKFDVRYIPSSANVTNATLYYYRQKSMSGTSMDIYHVTNDAWDPDLNTPPELYDWPTSGEPPISTPTGNAGWTSKNITGWLIQELGDTYFSLKFQQYDPPGNLYERIASPTAWYSKHRPYLVVTYTNASALGPDLTVNRHDIAFNTMWPVPYDPVTITATVHNVGGSATTGAFWVRFKDGVNTIGNVQIVNPIPGGNGTGTAQITWNPTEGIHDIEVVADVNGDVPEYREDNNTNVVNHDDYKFEVRGQYKFYVESFETENPDGSWGRYYKDADECYGGGPPPKREDWDVARVNAPPPPYDGSWFLNIWMDAGPFDDGGAWAERFVPIPAVPSATTFVEHSFFAHDQSGLYGHCPANASIQWYGPDLEDFDFQRPGSVSPPSWRRYRSYTFLTSDATSPQPEFWVGAGLRVTTNNLISDYFDQYTVRIGPPRSTQANATATAYNNGAKLVWDGLSYQHLIYVSGDSILYSKSEDPAGNTWSNAEFVGSGQHPAIALDIDGYPRAVWRTGRYLYYSKRSSTSWSTPYRLYTHPANHTVETPSLAIDGTYHGHVTWEHKSSTVSEILYGYFDATLTNPPLTASTVQASASGIRCQNPAIALDGNNPQIVYSRPPGSGQPTDIFQAKKQGSTWLKFNVSSSPSAGSDHPHMVIQNGDIQVVWSEGGGSEIYHRTYLAFFGVWGSITNVSNTSGWSDYPRIVMPGYHVVWMDLSESWNENLYPKPPASKNPWQIYYTSPGAVPGTWNPAVNLVPTYENSNYPHATRWQDLIGNIYLTAVHTEGDVSLYTLEATVKSLSAPPPGGSGGEMLLAVNADQPAPGGSRALWLRVPFDVPRDLEISFAIAGSANNDDEMKLVLDGQDYGWNTPEAWNGRELRGERKVVRLRTSLSAGSHTLELHASGQPVFKGLRVWHGNVGGGPQSSGLVTDVPTSTFLAQSFPNPTFGKATISYGLTKEGPVKLSIYNALGQVVRELVSENQRPGFHRVEWDGKSLAGKQVTSGIYFYRLNVGGFSKTNKLVVVR